MKHLSRIIGVILVLPIVIAITIICVTVLTVYAALLNYCIALNTWLNLICYWATHPKSLTLEQAAKELYPDKDLFSWTRHEPKHS